jgi:hypothetical protein
VWREGLLARTVLRGTTKGYRNHSQLDRFSAHPAPISAINHYLRAIASEAISRGYRFDRSRIGPVRDRSRLTVTIGQLEFELSQLRAKLRKRAQTELERLPTDDVIRPHPIFVVCIGPVESWERGAV